MQTNGQQILIKVEKVQNYFYFFRTLPDTVKLNPVEGPGGGFRFYPHLGRQSWLLYHHHQSIPDVISVILAMTDYLSTLLSNQWFCSMFTSYCSIPFCIRNSPTIAYYGSKFQKMNNWLKIWIIYNSRMPHQSQWSKPIFYGLRNLTTIKTFVFTW